MGKFSDKIQQKKEKLIALQQENPELNIMPTQKKIKSKPKASPKASPTPIANESEVVEDTMLGESVLEEEVFEDEMLEEEEEVAPSKFQDIKAVLTEKLDSFFANEKNLTIPLCIAFIVLALLFSKSYFKGDYNLDLTSIYSQILGGQAIKPAFVFNDKGYLTLNMNLQEVMQEVVTPEIIAGYIPPLKTFQPMDAVPLLITLIILDVVFVCIPKIPKLKIYCTNLFLIVILAINTLLLGANIFYHYSGVESYNKKVQQELTIEKIQNTCYSYYTSTCSDMKSWLINSLSDCKFYDTEGTYSTVITIPQQYVVDLLMKHPEMDRVVPTYFQLDQYLYKARGIESDQIIYVFNKKINLLELE